ncbi:hypothetical protein Tco_0832324 [Tanacetum coccineum]
MQRLLELEKKIEALSKVDHSKATKESVQANVINVVKNQLLKFLPKAVFDFVNPRIESTVHNVLQKSSVFLATRVEEPAHKVAMDVKEPILDDVVDQSDYPQDDANPKNDKSTWFKQPPT